MDTAYAPPIFRLPFPLDFADEEDADVLARAESLCATAETIFQCANASNQTIPISADDQLAARLASDSKNAIASIQTTAVALHLTALLSEYDMKVVQSAGQLRNFCTNILIEKAAEGRSETVQLRAVELLGKIKDVALFEERSTVLIEHMSTDQIKNRLKEKIGRLYGVQRDRQAVTDVVDNHESRP